MKKRNFKVDEKDGNLSYGIFWISADGRLETKWFNKYEDAIGQYKHLKTLGRQPSFNIRIEDKDLK